MADLQQAGAQQEMPGQPIGQQGPAVPVRKTLALVNEFVSSTAAFLGHFAAICEDKLDDVAKKLSHLENEVVLLERKLDSIPGLAPSSAAASQVPSSAVPDVQPTGACGMRSVAMFGESARPMPGLVAGGPRAPSAAIPEDHTRVRGPQLRRPLRRRPRGRLAPHPRRQRPS